MDLGLDQLLQLSSGIGSGWSNRNRSSLRSAIGTTASSRFRTVAITEINADRSTDFSVNCTYWYCFNSTTFVSDSIIFPTLELVTVFNRIPIPLLSFSLIAVIVMVVIPEFDAECSALLSSEPAPIVCSVVNTNN